MEDKEMEVWKLMRSKYIFQEFSEKNVHLICPDNPTNQEHNDVQVKRFTSHSRKI